jgi:sugar fermentation stimulation protein A
MPWRSGSRRPGERALPDLGAPDPVRGTYVLVVALELDLTMTVGMLGHIDFRNGLYAYCGSAMAGYRGRVGRHFAKEKKVRWHIDYLLREAQPVAAFLVRGGEGVECSLGAMISGLEGSEPVPGFGCSDCSCVSHLFRIEEGSLSAMTQAIDRMNENPVHRRND